MALSIANLNVQQYNVQQTRRNPSRVLLKKSSSLRTTKSTARRLLADVTKSITAVESKTGEEERRVQPLPQVPAGLRDIDVEEEDNPALCYEYAPLIYKYLRQVEREQVIRKDFLKGCMVTGKMRAVLLDWLIEVHLQFKLLQETLYMTIFLIDRYLQAEGLTLKRDQLQLVGVTAMFTACKVEEMYAPELNDFVYITDNAYSAAQIRQMELKMLQALNFQLGRPLPLHFLRRFSKAGDVDVLQHTLAKYIVELAQVEYDLASLAPSLLAASSLYLSLIVLTPDMSIPEVWSSSLEYYSEYKAKDLLPTIKKLASVLSKAENAKLKAVFNKYSMKRLMKVSEMACLRTVVLQELAAAK